MFRGMTPMHLPGIGPAIVGTQFMPIVAAATQVMTKQQTLDLYFMDARARLIDLAAFLDRVDRAEGEADFRLEAFRTALKELGGRKPERAERVLLSLSDPTTKPIAKAPGKGAIGAWPGND